jgi:hypothetical protein
MPALTPFKTRSFRAPNAIARGLGSRTGEMVRREGIEPSTY